ncbi:MAG: hypothetical protein IKX37_03190 [Bacteroidales bacterium]|jgi:hypothetical protein|nr:hypothetical protein [Bacteroidales bacterium]
MPRKKKMPGVDPGYLDKQRQALLHRHRQVIYLNDMEREAIDEYCRRFNPRARSVLLREAIMQRILDELDQSHPTLF